MTKPLQSLQKVKVRKIGNSLGVTLPKEVLAQLNVDEGDDITFLLGEHGLVVSAYDPEFEEVMELTQEGMRRYRNTLRELAK